MGRPRTLRPQLRRDSLGAPATPPLYSEHPPPGLAGMDWRRHIRTDPEIMHGAPCFVGTRVPVYVVLDNLAAGESQERILDQYPSLKPEHIPAAIAYAADLARERILPIPA